jgi:hypothetical protein
MRFPKLLGYSIQNTLLRRCVGYAKNPYVVVARKKYSPHLYSAADRRATRRHLRFGYYVRACSDLTGEICTRWNERESTWRKSRSCRSRGTNQSKS